MAERSDPILIFIKRSEYVESAKVNGEQVLSKVPEDGEAAATASEDGLGDGIFLAKVIDLCGITG